MWRTELLRRAGARRSDHLAPKWQQVARDGVPHLLFQGRGARVRSYLDCFHAPHRLVSIVMLEPYFVSSVWTFLCNWIGRLWMESFVFAWKWRQNINKINECDFKYLWYAPESSIISALYKKLYRRVFTFQSLHNHSPKPFHLQFYRSRAILIAIYNTTSFRTHYATTSKTTQSW